MEQKTGSRFFSAKELACKCGCGKGLAEMEQAFLNRLDMLRTSFGGPLTLTSAFRCNNYNMKVGGEKKSQHLYGKAVDISCTDSLMRHKLVSIATSLGFSVGIDSAFIHVDNREAPRVMWLYPVKP